MAERALRAPAPTDADHLERVRQARAEGRVPDVILGDVLVGDGPLDHLEAVDVTADELEQLVRATRLPRWVIAKNPLSGGFVDTKALMRSRDLVTVCEEAACPNIGRCWARRTATFMIAGAQCTRGCRFCNVATGRPSGPPDPDEPERVARTAAEMGLRFVVVTAVARDDIPDGGAAHFAATIRALREHVPGVKVEVLIPDLRGAWDALDVILDAAPDVMNHNTETVPRLYARVRPGARYESAPWSCWRGRPRPACAPRAASWWGWASGSPRSPGCSPTWHRWAASWPPLVSTCAPRWATCR
ncbi:MAG: lipoyl synthase [Thermoleophilia bacterium]